MFPLLPFGHRQQLHDVEHDALRSRREIEKLLPAGQELIPVRVVAGQSGLHAWFEEDWETTGVRREPTAGIRFGTVTGLNSATKTWMPARMPDGSTLTGFPIKAWARRTTSTRQGDQYELIIPPRRVGVPTALVVSFTMSSPGTSNSVTFTDILLTAPGTYLLWGEVLVAAATLGSGSSMITPSYLGLSVLSGDNGTAALYGGAGGIVGGTTTKFHGPLLGNITSPALSFGYVINPFCWIIVTAGANGSTAVVIDVTFTNTLNGPAAQSTAFTDSFIYWSKLE